MYSYKERLFYKATSTISFADSGSSSPSMDTLNTKFVILRTDLIQLCECCGDIFSLKTGEF